MLLSNRRLLTCCLICIGGTLLTWIASTGQLLSVAKAAADPAAGQPVKADSAAKNDDATDAKKTFFREKVLPLLESRCFECHGPDSEKKGDLNLSSRASALAGGESGAAIVPDKPDESLLIQAVRYEGFEMPPRSRMPDEEIEILSQWITDGAVWPEGDAPEPAAKPKAAFPLQERIASHWAWKKIERPTVPEVKHTDWPARDIDRFLLAKLEEAGITPSPDADRRAILRRLYFDLIGLPPTIEQQNEFFDDPAETPVAMEKVIGKLLASPQYGERWGRHWLDLVRYAETLGHEFDYPLPYAWRYRDYVIRAINADVPYNDFVREHIAGDLIKEPRRNPERGFNESIIATGYWYLCEDKHAPVDVKGEEATRIDNQIDVFGKTFLGLTIACARCHDHKFDAITADDYYGLSGFLQSSRRRVEWLDAEDQTASLLTKLLALKSDATAALNGGISEIDSKKLTNTIQAIVEGGTENEATLRGEFFQSIKTIINDPKSLELSHPLSLFSTISQRPTDKPADIAVHDWMKSRTRLLEAELSDSSDPFEEMDGWLPYNWFAFGPAMFDYLSIDQEENLLGSFVADLPRKELWNRTLLTRHKYPATRFTQLKWSPSGIVTDARNFVSSAQLSPQLTGTVHSREFVLECPEIMILAAGQKARVRLVIDGYVMNEFSELLFSGCRQTIDTDGKYRWIRMGGDIKRYVGHRCHLEFLDDGAGWFSIREIVMLAKPGETPPLKNDICLTNRTILVAETFSIPRLINEWTKIITQDPEWANVVLMANLIPEPQRAGYELACKEWTKLSVVPPVMESPVLTMCEGTGEEEHVFVRGNHKNPGPAAYRHLLTALDGDPNNIIVDSGSGRMELADRVLADSNPFPARVAVNRVWQHLFGRGIVATSENFGVLGEAPTHPELLDLLADDFRKDGWSIKRLIKRLMLTRAYRLSSQRNELAEEKDPTNKLLHRFSVRRLEAEVIRDEILAISGRLDPTSFGPPVPTYLTSFMEGRGRPGESGPLDGNGRRSIYQSVRRNFLNPFMLAFDTPQPATAIARRSVSNVPAQSLILMNNEFVHQQANVWAKHLLSAGSLDDTAIVTTAYRAAFARSPSETELASLLEFAHADASNSADTNKTLPNETILTNLCHVLLNQKELLFLE